ncbi:MAG: autotransporter outer membrane beta-barrel domain-containing protein [Planctomycetota bacterium]|nr:autotransporter outer membrane beta-barrel domain-containing protein [Planctomycetota bacterium]
MPHPCRNLTFAALMAALVMAAPIWSAAAATPVVASPNISLASIAVQRVFRSTLPSVADYSQTAHTQAKANEAVVSSDYALASPICGASICGPNSNWVMWDTPFLLFDNKRARDGDWGYNSRSSGFATGLTRLFGEYKSIGLALGYDERSLKGRDGVGQREDGDAFHAALYGGIGIGDFFMDAYAGFSWTSQRANRGAGAISANYNDAILSGGLKLSYVWCLPNEVRIAPAIGLDYSRLHSNAFAERGPGGDILGRADRSAAELPISLSVNRTFYSNFLAFGDNRSLWTPEARVSFAPQFGSRRAGVDSLSSGIRHESARAGRYQAAVGTGLKIQINNRFILALDYDYRFGDRGESSHLVTGTYGISF